MKPSKKTAEKIVFNEKQRGTRGGIVLFLSFLLPVLLFSIIIVVEITTISFGNSSLQNTLDSAVVASAQRLPNTSAAIDTFKTLIPADLVQNLSVTSESIEATISAPQKTSLIGYFGIDRKFSTTATARAMIPPLAVTIALDTNQYTAPAASDSTWRAENLPPAAIFTIDSEINSEFAQEQTQFCFNNLLLPLKRLATQTFSSLKKLSNYNLSAITYPATVGPNESTPGISVIKRGEQSAPTWLSYESLNRSNGRCAAIALHDSLFNPSSPYAFPQQLASSFGGTAPTGERIVDLEAMTFNPNYTPHLSVEEVIWSQSAREQGGMSTVGAIESIARFALSEYESNTKRTESKGRSKSEADSVIAVVLAGDVPRSSTERFPAESVKRELSHSLSSLNEAAKKSGINLYIPYFVFENSTGVKVEEGDALNQFVKGLNSALPHIKLSVFMTRDSSEIERSLLPFLKHLHRPVVLSK